MWQLTTIVIITLPLFTVRVLAETAFYVSANDAEMSAGSGGGIVVESFLSIRTVASLTLEQGFLDQYERCLFEANTNYV